MFWLPAVATLVAGDRLIGAEGGAAGLAQSWRRRVHVNRPGLAERARALVDLPIERVLVSHGDPSSKADVRRWWRAIAGAKGD